MVGDLILLHHDHFARGGTNFATFVHTPEFAMWVVIVEDPGEYGITRFVVCAISA